MAAKQRLQELFAKYDTSGDGVLSEEEMLSVPLANVFLKDDGWWDGHFRLLSLSSGAVMWDGLKCEAAEY